MLLLLLESTCCNCFISKYPGMFFLMKCNFLTLKDPFGLCWNASRSVPRTEILGCMFFMVSFQSLTNAALWSENITSIFYFSPDHTYCKRVPVFPFYSGLKLVVSIEVGVWRQRDTSLQNIGRWIDTSL
jgi:hypothetical protein